MFTFPNVTLQKIVKMYIHAHTHYSYYQYIVYKLLVTGNGPGYPTNLCAADQAKSIQAELQLCNDIVKEGRNWQS